MELFGVKANEYGIPSSVEEERLICRTLITHLRDHHPLLHAETVPHTSHTTRRQPTLQEVVDKSKRYDPKSPQAQEIIKAIAYYIAMQSLCTMEKPGFRHLIHILDPKYNLPGNSSLSKKYPGCMLKLGRWYNELYKLLY